MTNDEAIRFIDAIKRGLKSTGKDYPYRDEYIPKMKEACDIAIEALEQKPTEKCKWIKYDYRTICPKECGGENPYWRIPENMENLKYCPYCGREIEVEL